jgi:hypothetical protein
MGAAREALACVVGDADRAGDIIARISDQIKKAPPRKEVFDLNAAILEVAALTHSEALKTGTVSIEPEAVCVAVRDTGHGLRPESLPRLFEPFGTTKPDGMGTGPLDLPRDYRSPWWAAVGDQARAAGCTLSVYDPR